MQGCLRGEALSATIQSRCAATGRAIVLEVDHLGGVRILEGGVSPLLFEPEIDWESFRKPHIIDDF